MVRHGTPQLPSVPTLLLALWIALLLGAAPASAQPTFTDGVLPNGIPDGATGTNVLQEPPLFYDPPSGDYRPNKPAGSPLVDLAGNDAPRDDRLLNGQTQTEGGWDAGALESNGAALPVELADFSATPTGGNVQLTWITASERNNARFRVQRQAGRSTLNENAAWATLGAVDGAGTTTDPQQYRFTDANPPFAAKQIRYRLVQVDVGGGTTASDPVVVERAAPTRTRLLPPYPNPARNAVSVRVTLPDKLPEKPPRLAIFDVLGRRVTTRMLETRGGNRRVVRFNVSMWPSGLYVVRLQVGTTTRTERLTVVQ